MYENLNTLYYIVQNCKKFQTALLIQNKNNLYVKSTLLALKNQNRENIIIYKFNLLKRSKNVYFIFYFVCILQSRLAFIHAHTRSSKISSSFQHLFILFIYSSSFFADIFSQFFLFSFYLLLKSRQRRKENLKGLHLTRNSKILETNLGARANAHTLTYTYSAQKITNKRTLHVRWMQKLSYAISIKNYDFPACSRE